MNSVVIEFLKKKTPIFNGRLFQRIFPNQNSIQFFKQIHVTCSPQINNVQQIIIHHTMYAQINWMNTLFTVFIFIAIVLHLNQCVCLFFYMQFKIETMNLNVIKTIKEKMYTADVTHWKLMLLSISFAIHFH